MAILARDHSVPTPSKICPEEAPRDSHKTYSYARSRILWNGQKKQRRSFSASLQYRQNWVDMAYYFCFELITQKALPSIQNLVWPNITLMRSSCPDHTVATSSQYRYRRVTLQMYSITLMLYTINITLQYLPAYLKQHYWQIFFWA